VVADHIYTKNKDLKVIGNFEGREVPKAKHFQGKFETKL